MSNCSVNDPDWSHCQVASWCANIQRGNRLVLAQLIASLTQHCTNKHADLLNIDTAVILYTRNEHGVTDITPEHNLAKCCVSFCFIHRNRSHDGLYTARRLSGRLTRADLYVLFRLSPTSFYI